MIPAFGRLDKLDPAIRGVREEFVLPAWASHPPHAHAETEHFHVIRDRLTVRLGNDALALDPGDTILIPSGILYAFLNKSGDEVEFFSVATPAEHKNFFRDANELARSGRFNPATAAGLCQKHGIKLH